MNSILGSYRHPSQESPASLQLGLCGGWWGGRAVLAAALPCAWRLVPVGYPTHTHRPRPGCSPKASSPAPAACPHTSSEKVTLSPASLSSQKTQQGFVPTHPDFSWMERRYSSPNHTPGTPCAVKLGPCYRSPVTYLSSVTVPLRSSKFNCKGHLAGLNTLKLVELDVDPHLTHESSPR